MRLLLMIANFNGSKVDDQSVFMYAVAEPINWLAALAMAICYCHIIVKIVKIPPVTGCCYSKPVACH